MSVSPPKDGEPAGDAASPDNSEQMERGEEAQAREAYDFDVKEQDRWLPIANGWFPNFPSFSISFCGSSRCLKRERIDLNFARLCRLLRQMHVESEGLVEILSLVSIAGNLACATSTGFLFPQPKDLRQHIRFFTLYGQGHTSLSGCSSCPEFPRHLHRERPDLITQPLMLTYGISLQWHVS